MNSEASTTAVVQRSMTDQHRKHLSASMKHLWARRGGLSEEHRQRISHSVKSMWARKASMPHI